MRVKESFMKAEVCLWGCEMGVCGNIGHGFVAGVAMRCSSLKWELTAQEWIMDKPLDFKGVSGDWCGVGWQTPVCEKGKSP